MSKFDWKAALGKVAPALATALGGPLAGVAVGMATKALGVENDEGALAAAVATGDPNVLVQLKQVEVDFKIKLKELDVQLDELTVKDRASARAMAIATSISPQLIISTLFIGGFIALLYRMFASVNPIPEQMMEPALYLLGILSAGIAQIMGFWFGSSFGSKQKTQALAQSTPARRSTD